MERARFYERDTFTYEEKMDVAAKSDNKCCHCGKEKYFGYGATIDHFIPLFKGGSNRKLNLIMLCDECNREKADKIVTLAYLPYLKKKYVKELNDYLESYIHSFEYVERNNIFACDEYSFGILPQIYGKQSKHLKKQPLKGIEILMKKATYNDFARLCDYFEKYLKKYDILDSREAVEANIWFWLKFGCIYYFEKDKEIKVMSVYTIKHITPDKSDNGMEYVLNMYLFSYYANGTYISLCSSLVKQLIKHITEEQQLEYIPVALNLLCEDKITPYICSDINKSLVPSYGSSGFCTIYLSADTKDNPNLERTKAYFDKFADIGNALLKFLKYDPTGIWVNWMIYDLLSPQDVKDKNIFEEGSELYNLNEAKIFAGNYH